MERSYHPAISGENPVLVVFHQIVPSVLIGPHLISNSNVNLSFVPQVSVYHLVFVVPQPLDNSYAQFNELYFVLPDSTMVIR